MFLIKRFYVFFTTTLYSPLLMIFHVAMHRHRGESVPLELAPSFGDKVQPLLHDNYTDFLQSKSSITALQVKATTARKPHKNTTLVTSFCVWKFLIFSWVYFNWLSGIHLFISPF